MTPATGRRIFGVETEFGCLVQEGSGKPEDAVELIKDHVFSSMKSGVLDLHTRDMMFEPSHSGGFLINGGRLYIDAVGSHLEYATAECQTLDDLVANDRAGQRLILQAIQELQLTEEVSVYNNSVDHFGGHTFGCHENYLVRMSPDFFSTEVQLLYPFLATRQLFAGVGRVGGHILMEGGHPDYQAMAENPVDYVWVSNVYDVYEDDEISFQLSQRADHIIRTVASRVRFNRAMINPKWEHFYAHEGMHRLHLLFGEANQSEYAYKLKVGTTHLVLRLLDDGLLDNSVNVEHPLLALRDVSRDQTMTWNVRMANGETQRATDVQRHYLKLAERYGGSDNDTDWVLREWRSVLDTLDTDPMSLGDRLDWVAKKQIVEAYREETGCGWDDPALHSVDLEYHNIDPSRSLFYALQEDGAIQREIDDLRIIESMVEPPADTRAKGRSSLVKSLVTTRRAVPYMVDWSSVSLGPSRHYEMPDPFDTYEDAFGDFESLLAPKNEG